MTNRFLSQKITRVQPTRCSKILPGLSSAIAVASWNWFLGLLLTVCVLGCSPEPIAYRDNLLVAYRAEKEAGIDLSSAKPLVTAILDREFGTIDQPKLPKSILENPSFDQLIDMKSVERSAGPVFRVQEGESKVEYGLFRKHCAACHGVSGDGYGAAAALLDPYPRDFRRGTFKFGSQGQGKPPSHSDLVKVIVEGIPGTGMPAMRSLDGDAYFKDDCETLAHYVQFLAMRGEVERRLWLEVVPELELSQIEAALEASNRGSFPSDLQESINLVIKGVADRWAAVIGNAPAESQSSMAYRWPQDLETEARTAMLESARRGSALFRSEVTACIQCHGEKGDGNGRLVDYDEWTKDWTIRLGIDPRDPDQWKPLKKLGLLKPVPDKARNLQLGVFRGGNDPQMIFDRLAHGIDGTPMPAVPRVPASPVGLAEEQVWDLVNYCQALAYVSDEELQP